MSGMIEITGLSKSFGPFVAVAGTDKPAVSAAEKQLCVEGLRHGETYTVTLRAGLPSVVHESLSKSADFSVYVRDRKPAVHFATTAYVLPRTGQRGIPVISTNTRSIAVEIYRIGDRNLTEVDIYCIFYDSYGQVVLRKRVPIVGQRISGLKPGDGKSFRLPFDEIPESWNHTMPQLVIAGIKFS